jgi:phosphoglycerate dehydrogenase-like enzyme
MAEPIRIFCLVDDPDRVPDMIRARHPQAEITVCTDYDKTAAAVKQSDPEIAYTMVFARTEYPRAPILAAPNLRWIHVSGAGVNHLAPWDPEKVSVSNVGGIQDEGMAQFAHARLIAMATNFFTYHDQQKQHRWEHHDCARSHGGVLTVVGLGQIGRACARLGKAMGMTVNGVRARPAPCEGVDRVVGPADMHEVLATSDWVIIVTPLTRETENLFDGAAFAALKPGAFLVNMARGKVMDENAMVEALRSGRLAGASIDVFAEEPLPADSPLWDEPGLHITPHSAGFITFEDYDTRGTELFLDNMDRYLKGEALINVTDPVRGY